MKRHLRALPTPGMHTQRMLRQLRHPNNFSMNALRTAVEMTGARRVVITEPEPRHVLVTYSGGPSEDLLGDVVDQHRPVGTYIGVRQRKDRARFWLKVLVLVGVVHLIAWLVTR